MGLSKITEKIIFNKTIIQITAACTVFGILIYAYLTSMMNTRRFSTGDDLSGDFGLFTDAEGFYGRAVNMVNVTAYHIKQRECLREGLQYSASRLEEERKSVKITLAFPKIEWMPHFKNPCQDIQYRLTDKKEASDVQSLGCTGATGTSMFEPISCLPYVYIGGVQKAGTSNLFWSLKQHPMIFTARAEPEFWTDKFRGSKAWSWRTYFQMYSNISTCVQAIKSNDTFHHGVILEDSPGTIWELKHWPLYPGNENALEPVVTPVNLIHNITPQARMIAIFRNPIERLYSHFYHRCRYLKNITRCSKEEFHTRAVEMLKAFTNCIRMRSLRECVYDTCIHRSGDSRVLTLRASLYHVFVEDLLKVFPREQLYFVHFETYTADRLKELSLIYSFLGLDPLSDKRRSLILKGSPRNERKPQYKYKGDMLQETRQMLQTFFQPYNTRLRSLLKDDRFLWT